MAGVDGIRGSARSAPTQKTNTQNASSAYQSFKISFQETFTFPQKKLAIKENANAQASPQENPYYRILLKLFTEILECRIDIVPTQPTDQGGYAVEAFFRPPENIRVRGAIHLPLPIRALSKKPLKAPSGEGRLPSAFAESLSDYVMTVVTHFTNEQIVRLLIVATHEYGHYQSFTRGNHDENLKRGLYIFKQKYMNTKQADEFTWLVFREECVAWNYAEAFLKKANFDSWEGFEEVKNHSLKTYFEHLKLNDASLDTYYKLSFLGEDFKKNSLSQFFTKKELVTAAG